MARGGEDVGGEAEGVVVDVVVVEPDGVGRGPGVARGVVVHVAAPELGVVAAGALGRLLTGVGCGARVEAGVPAGGRGAVLDQPVVGGEREHAVLLGLEGLEALDPVAVDLVRVDAVLGDVADGDVGEDEPVGAVGLDADVLRRVDRRAVAGRDAAAVDDHVVGADAGPLHLEVAAEARSRVRDGPPLGQRRLRGRRAGLAADHRDQVLVVGARRDVAV
jgi:hypothetical protein